MGADCGADNDMQCSCTLLPALALLSVGGIKLVVGGDSIGGDPGADVGALACCGSGEEACWRKMLERVRGWSPALTGLSLSLSVEYWRRFILTEGILERVVDDEAKQKSKVEWFAVVQSKVTAGLNLGVTPAAPLTSFFVH